MKIDCFDKVGLPHLAEKFKSSVTEGMSEAEQRDLGKQIASDYAKDLHDQLNDLKRTIGKPETPFTPEDKSKEVDAIKEEYQQKIDEVNPPPPPPPTAEELAKAQDDEEWTAIRKEKLREIKGAKRIFDNHFPKSWNETYESALANVQEMYPKKSLYEAMKSRVTDLLMRMNAGELHNPTSEDIAVFNVYRDQTEQRLANVEGQDSEDSIVRMAANAEIKNYEQDLYNLAKVANTAEGGRAFNMRQSEVKSHADNELKIRRMKLMDDNGGEPLSPEDEAFVKKETDNLKELDKRQRESEVQQMKDDFDAKIKDIEAKLKIAKGEKPESKREKTLTESGKDLADKIRKLKTQKGDTALDVTLGLKNLAVEAVAQLVEQGAKLADAIKNVLTDEKYKGLTEDDLTNHIIEGLDRQENKEASFDKLKEFAKENETTDITPDMVKKNLIRDFVNSHIGEVEQKELFDEAFKGLKEILPNATKEKFLEAYLKENEFRQPTKKEAEGSLAQSKRELENIAKLTEDIADLENEKEIRKRNFPTEREKSEAEKELLAKKEALIKEKKDEAKRVADELKKAEQEENKNAKKIQAKKDKLDELNAGIERAEKGYDQIKTHNEKSTPDIDKEVGAKKKELRKAIKTNATDEQQQKKALDNAIKNEKQKIKDFTERLAEGNFEDDAPAPKLKKQTAELINIAKERSEIEERFRKKQNELREQKKSTFAVAADFVRSTIVAILIGAPKTLAKVGSMSLIRPASEAATKLTLGKVYNALFPNISHAAKLGGESSSTASVKAGFEAYFRQMGEKQVEAVWDKANEKYDAANKAYEDYKDSDNPDPKKLKELKDKNDAALVKAMGSFVYKYIGGSSIKDAMGALVNRANEIEKQFGHIESEHINDAYIKNSTKGTARQIIEGELKEAQYILGFIGRSHSALKTFSGRFSFAAGFMARLEGAIERGEDITTSDKMLEVANESYLDWERGKYQQSNVISDLWNKMINSLEKGETGSKENAAKIAKYILQTDVAITRVPVNIIHEALVEYTLGAFKAAYMGSKAVREAKSEVKKSGINPDTPEFKEALKEQIKNIPPEQAATIVRCFRKGGIGVGLYALALISGAVHFGIYPHMGQKKKKKEEDLRPDELNPGQVMIGGHKFGEVASGIIEHVPMFWTTLMGLGLAQEYKDQIDKGKTTTQAVWKSIITHLQIIEGNVPQAKLFSPTKLVEKTGLMVEKKMTDAGLMEDTPEGQKAIKNYKNKGADITDAEFKAYNTKKEEELQKQLEKLKKGELPENVVWDDKLNKPVTKKYDDMDYKQSVAAMRAIKSQVTSKVKKEMFGEKPESQKDKEQELRDARDAKKNN